MPQIIVPEGYYTEEEMAIRLNKSVSTLKVFRSSKKSAIPPYVKIGRTILYKIESFQRWLDSKEQNNNMPPHCKIGSRNMP